jgi:hypothetical protein
MSQEPKRPLTPEEILDAIEESEADDEAERILALSDDDLDRELQNAGFDPKAVRERGAELAARHGANRPLAIAPPAVAPPSAAPPSAAPPSAVPSLATPAPRRPVSHVRARWVVWSAAAALAVALAAVSATNYDAMMALFRRGDHRWDIGPDEAGLPWNEVARHQAEKLRDEADEACGLQLWARCSARLDDAKALDPAGESEERVQRWRQKIDDIERTEAPPDKPPMRR